MLSNFYAKPDLMNVTLHSPLSAQEVITRIAAMTAPRSYFGPNISPGPKLFDGVVKEDWFQLRYLKTFDRNSSTTVRGQIQPHDSGSSIRLHIVVGNSFILFYLGFAFFIGAPAGMLILGLLWLLKLVIQTHAVMFLVVVAVVMLAVIVGVGVIALGVYLDKHMTENEARSMRARFEKALDIAPVSTLAVPSHSAQLEFSDRTSP